MKMFIEEEGLKTPTLRKYARAAEKIFVGVHSQDDVFYGAISRSALMKILSQPAATDNQWNVMVDEERGYLFVG